MRVSEVMTRQVISISPESTIQQAIELMLKRRVSGLLVTDDKGKLLGIVTEGDFLRRAEIGTERSRRPWLDAFFGPGDAAKDYVRSHGRKVQDVMTRDPVTVPETASLDKVVEVMERHNIKRLPVMRRGKVVGVVSRADLMLALASISRAASAPTESDSMIRDHILSAIREQSWSAGAVVDVVVRQGVADIWGTISDVAQRDALRTLVESTPGVDRVEDHLTWQGERLSVT